MRINNYFDIKTKDTRSREEKNLLEQLGIRHHIRDLFLEERNDTQLFNSSKSGVSTVQIENLVTHVSDKKIHLRRRNAILELKNLLKTDEDTINHLNSLMNINFSNYSFSDFDPRLWMPDFFHFANAAVYFREQLNELPNCKIFSEELNNIITNSSAFEFGKYWGIDMVCLYDLKDKQTELASKVEIQNKSKILYQEFKEKMNFPFTDSAIMAVEAIMPIRSVLGAMLELARILNSSELNNGEFILPNTNSEGIFEIERAKPLGDEFNVERNWDGTITDDRIPYDLKYSKNSNHFIYSGPHSGGKTIRLQSIGAKYLLASSAIPLRMKRGNISLVDNIHSFIEIDEDNKNKGKGSLEEEIYRISNLRKKLGENDLVLIDEFLDTTKPELAKYIAPTLLNLLGESKSAIHVVYHAANSLDLKNSNFRCFYPEIKYKLEKETNLVPCEDDPYLSYICVETGNKIRKYYPTRKFLEGLPNSRLIKKHTEQMWHDIIKKPY